MSFTDQEEMFSQLIVDGKNRSDAFREIRPHVNKWKDKSIHEAASKLYAKVLPRIDELREELAKKNLWSRERGIIALVKIVESKFAIDDVEIGAKDSDIINAVKELNSMHGFNEPIKTQQIGADGKPIDKQPTIIKIVGA